MKVVIELSKEDMESYKNAMRRGFGNSATRKIINGTPLPEDAEILTAEAYSDLCLRASHERKEGFWDVYTDCEGKRTYYTCPFCKNKTNHFMYEPKYCDKCGARLKKEGAEG